MPQLGRADERRSVRDTRRMQPMSLAELSKPRLQVQVSLSKRLIARALWDYAEDAHVQRALDLTEDEHAKVQHICAWYDLPEYPLPVSGQRITNNHVCALAAITLFEGSVRPLAQMRRRPAKSCPPALQD